MDWIKNKVRVLNQEPADTAEAKAEAKADAGWFRRHARTLLITLGVMVLLLGVMWQRCGIKGCPDVGTLKGYMPDEASTIVDYQGHEVGKLFLTRRTIVPIDSMPEHVTNAFIAMEDKRFWDHNGVDWRRVGGAAYKNIKELGIAEGSSTITMQLARNAFPDQLPANQRTLWRKLAEARVAKAIEKEYTKQEILQLYLNQIYFGNGAYGIEAAAQEYYGKAASQLNLPEAATLAALPRAPSRLNPRNSREKALEGRKIVLSRMAEQNLITPEAAEEAKKARLRLAHAKVRADDPAPYFVESVRTLLEENLGDAIYSKGYTIHTTLDIKMQRTLETELANQLRAIESGAFGTYRHSTLASERADTTDDDDGEGPGYLQTAALFMDAKTGDIRALVGGRNFEDSQFNRATNANRQPGSAFKPFVYAAAFAEGYSPTYRLIDRPLRLVLARNQVWEPKNYDGGYSGVISMRDALTYSKNVPTIRLANEIGITRVIDMARQMGLSGRIPAVPSVVLGTAEVTPIDMTGAFAGFANLGDRPMPRFVTRVVDRDGEVVWSQETETRSVIDPAVAFMTVSLMQDVVNRGTGTGVRGAGYRDPAAGKTGTTNDAADIWFIGFTPDIVGTIWMGFDKRKSIMAGTSATGGDLAAPVWGRVMAKAGPRSTGWTAPGGVETRVVDSNGNVTAENCPVVGGTRREYFIQGTAPVTTCYPSYESYSLNDSLYGMPDTATYMEGTDDDGWWAKMRERIFRERQQDQAMQNDTMPTPPPAYPPSQTYPNPTPAQPVPSPTNPQPNPNPATLPPPREQPKPKPVPYDSLVRPAPDSAPREQQDSVASLR